MDNVQLMQSIDEWIAGNDFPPVLLAEGNGSNFAAGVTPVISAAVLTGPGRSQTLALGTKIKAAPVDEQLELFKKDYGTGCATVLNYARTKSGYDPSNIDDPKGKEKFANYLSRVQAAPFFLLQYARTVSVVNKSKNWDQLIDAIADTFEGLADENKKAVVKSLGSLAKVAASTEDTKQTEDLFVQSVLNAGEEFDIYLYSSHVEMEAHTEKGSTSKQSVFKVTTVKLRLLKGFWPVAAEKVYKMGIKTVEDWLEDSTSDEGPLLSKLCISAEAA